MKAIAAVDKNWAIGNKGALLVSIPADHKFFKNETIGRTVILGRKTLETFPGAKPLPGRRNIILSRNPDYKVQGADIAHSKEELFKMLEGTDTDDVYVIGGASVYKELLSYCDKAVITKIYHSYEADAYFPDLDSMDEWVLTGESEEQTYFDIEYRFLRYEKK